MEDTDNKPSVAVTTTSSSSGSSSSASTFRAKVRQMKNWRPQSTPSNRDRLELYALHKQAISGNAPTSPFPTTTSDDTKDDSKISPAERAKFNAWKTKTGLSPSQAMDAYILEADRQLLVYGIRQQQQQQQQSAAEQTTGEGSFSPDPAGTTPRNTPAPDSNASTTSNTNNTHTHFETTSVLLTPRGLAAIPLLCAAASETRRAYLHRLACTSSGPSSSSTTTTTTTTANNNNNEGWWKRQEPLCGDPGTLPAIPESLLLTIASTIESTSLYLSTSCVTSPNSIAKTLSNVGIQPSVLQSLLWPLHNILLILWMLLIFLSTIGSSVHLICKTMLMGSRKTGVTLEEVFTQEIRPARIGAGSLCDVHQVVSVRLLGLVLYPLGMVCEFAEYCKLRFLSSNRGGGSGSGSGSGGLGTYIASGVYATVCMMLWWYWLIVLPMMANFGFWTAISIGWCFGLMELAGM